MTLTRDNHFVPQVYLKNFAADSKEVFEYRTLVSHSSVQFWKAVNVAGTGYEKDLYTRIVQGEEADDIEQWLNREFESPAAVALQKALEDQELTRADWEALVRFLACQIVRTPAFLLMHLPRWNQMAPKILNQTMKDVEIRLIEAKETGTKLADEPDTPHTNYIPLRVIRQELPEQKKVQFTTKMVVGRGLWFFAMKHLLSNTLNVLHRHNWTILEAPNRLDWFTSDDPVICLNFRSDSNYDFEGGWNRTGGNILFPISPRHLMFTEIGARSYPRRVPSRYHARLFRRIIAEHAHRRIYASKTEQKIVQLKPRIVDATLFSNERELWEAWYEDQSRAEQAL